MEAYANALNPNKECMLLINKADLVPLPVRKAWASFFMQSGVNFVFFSATIEQEKLNQEDT